MIDDIDISSSVLRLLASQALKVWDNTGVLKLLSEDDYIVRTLAARELHMRADKEIYEEVILFQKSSYSYMREICAFTLGQLGTPKMPYKNLSFPILLILINDKSADVRSASAAALGHLCYEKMPIKVEEALFYAISDDDMDVRCCAATALGNASNKTEANNVLQRLLDDSEQQVREYAQLGIDILESKV